MVMTGAIMIRLVWSRSEELVFLRIHEAVLSVGTFCRNAWEIDSVGLEEFLFFLPEDILLEITADYHDTP